MQLRLVESPTRELVRRKAGTNVDAKTGTKAGSKKASPARTTRATVSRGPAGRGGGRSAGGRGVRAVHWADWQLDARTRRVGRAGVAAAKAALEQAHRPEPGTPLSKAS